MSILAYDGKIIAADRQATCGDFKRTVHKMIKLDNGTILGWTGSQDAGLTLSRWWQDGADPDKYPDFQQGKAWCRLVVLTDGRLVTYEQTPDCFEFLDTIQAFGSGRDYAMGAMEMGADAIKAVEIASKHCTGCGMGIDWFEVR